MSHTHPHTPETLLDLLRMGTELETAETRIQKALRACILISLVTALKKEGKRARDQSQSTLSMTTHDSTVDESFSKVEQLLHMHQILPDHPVSIEIEKDNNNTTNSNNTFSGARHNTTRRGQWRYLPEDDAVALDLQSLVLRGMLDEKLSERLQAMLSASHLIGLLRKLVQGDLIGVSAQHRLRDIQVRLEDDICFFFEQLDNDRTVPSFRVALSMRVCAESMRQLWPHLSDVDDETESELEFKQAKATENTGIGVKGNKGEEDKKDKKEKKEKEKKEKKATTPPSDTSNTLTTRTPGPLVELFVFKSIRPLASFVELFSPVNEGSNKMSRLQKKRSCSLLGEQKETNDKKEQKDKEKKEFQKENKEQEQEENRNLELLTNLLERARSIVETRLGTLRVSLGQGMANGVSNVMSKNKDGLGRGSGGTSNGNGGSRSANQIVTNISETHLRFVHALLHDMYYNKEWGIGPAVGRAFGVTIGQPPNALSTSSTSSTSSTPTTSRTSSTTIRQTQESINTEHPDHSTTTSRFVFKDIVEAHKLAWSLVGGMSIGHEPEAASYAAVATQTLFCSVFQKHTRMEREDLMCLAKNVLNSWEESKQNFSSVRDAMVATLSRYEIMSMHEVRAMMHLFEFKRWDLHMGRMLMCWTDFVNAVETMVTSRVRRHLVDLATPTQSNQFLFQQEDTNDADKNELAKRIERNVNIALAVVRQLIVTAHDIVIPTLHRMDRQRQEILHSSTLKPTSDGSDADTDKQLFIQRTKDTSLAVAQNLKFIVGPLQEDIATALSEGWLKSATIELSQFHLSKQSTDDYVFTNEVLVPTNTCKTICSIFKSRKNSLKTLLTGENFIQMENALRHQLLNAVWSHILTLKIDTEGALRLMVDIEYYNRASQTNKIQVDRHQKSFELLRSMCGLLAIDIESIQSLFPNIVKAMIMTKDDLLSFVQRRHDWIRTKDKIISVVDTVHDLVH